MWHISFMGNKKNQEFKNDVLPKNSKKITNNSFWINGKFFSFILIATIISLTFYNFFTHPIKNHSTIELILCIIIGIIFLIPIFIVHEILHAIWFPKKAKKELWYEINRNSLFLFSFQIYSNCPLKRNRFLLMLLFPNIILALIPLFLWYCGIVFFSPFISRIIGSLLTILFTCGASDYSLFFDTILCTKKEDNIIIFKNEFYSSWLFARNSTANRIKCTTYITNCTISLKIRIYTTAPPHGWSFCTIMILETMSLILWKEPKNYGRKIQSETVPAANGSGNFS